MAFVHQTPGKIRAVPSHDRPLYWLSTNFRMRTSPFDKKLLRVALLAVVAAVSYWLCSSRAETKIRTVTDERPPMYVLQVGIGKYLHAPTWAELRGAVNDVVEMRKVLEGERYGIPAENIVTLTDAQGTKKQIFEQFETHLIANAKKQFDKTKDRRQGAIILFEFSGHGSQAPDVNGDEKDDGKDETLVTYDSDDKPGKNFDITDDEIYALTGKLRAFTDNIVYIFDSCHSGSGTRDSQDVRRLPERKTVPVAIDGVSGATRSGATKESDGNASLLPPGNDYIVITAAQPNELASQKNCFEECGATTRPVVYGNLTFYLIDELKNARRDTSYRELMENVRRRVVADKPTQTPQLEGDRARFVFSGLGRSEDNFIRITEADTKTAAGKRTVKINAGAMQGVAAGTIVSIYDKKVTRFDGAERIASGTISVVTASESTVELLSPTREIARDDKAVIVAPDLGTVKLKVTLDEDAAKLTAAEKRVVGVVQESLTPEAGVRLVGRDLPTWDVALLKDKFSSVVEKIPGASATDFKCSQPTGTSEPAAATDAKSDRAVFYLAGRDFVPLYRFCMETSFVDERASAARLRQVIGQMAALRSVNLIANKGSALSGKVSVQPMRLAGTMKCTNSVFGVDTYAKTVADPTTGSHPFKPMEMFWFEVTNKSAKPLYVALLNTDPNGGVAVLSPRGNRADESDGVIIPAGGKRIIVGNDCVGRGTDVQDAAVLFASRTPGLDRFKFIFSTARLVYEDLKFLEMPPISGQRAPQASLAGMNDWTTVETVFSVSDTGK